MTHPDSDPHPLELENASGGADGSQGGSTSGSRFDGSRFPSRFQDTGDGRHASTSGSTSGSGFGSQVDAHGSQSGSLLGSQDGSLDSLQTKEEDPRLASARKLVGTYQKAARSLRLYPSHSSVLRQMLEDFGDAVSEHVAAYGQMELTVREDTLSWGDDVLYQDADRSKSLAFKLFLNGVRLIRLREGIRADEADGVVHVLTRALDRDASTDVLRTAIWECAFDNVDFVISEELFSGDEEREYRAFVEQGESALADAVPAVAEADEVWRALEQQPAVESAVAFILDATDLVALEEEAKGELERELFDDLAHFLVSEFDGPRGAGVQEQVEKFLEHLVATGDILRAARVLGSLRRCADRHPDAARRVVIQDALSLLAKTRVIPQLRPILPTLDEEDRQALFGLVPALGEPAIAPLCDLLDSEYREAALNALQDLSRKYPRELLAFVQHPNAAIVRSCLELIGAAGDRDQVSGIMPALHHKDVGVRREALRALKALGGSRAIDLFIKALDDPGYEVRALAISAVGEHGGPKASKALLPRIEAKGFLSRNDFEKRETFRALGLIGTPEIIVTLVKLLGTRTLLRRAKQDELRALAASALGMIAKPAALNALKKQQKDPSDPVRRAVAAALQQHASRG